MTPFELQALAVKRFGAKDWLRRLASETGVNERTVRLWSNGETPITQAPLFPVICALQVRPAPFSEDEMDLGCG